MSIVFISDNIGARGALTPPQIPKKEKKKFYGDKVSVELQADTCCVGVKKVFRCKKRDQIKKHMLINGTPT